MGRIYLANIRDDLPNDVIVGSIAVFLEVLNHEQDLDLKLIQNLIFRGLIEQ